MSIRIHILFQIVIHCLLLFPLAAQEGEGPFDILMQIKELQITSDDFYDSGLFPTKRSWFDTTDPVEDNNIFVTASIGYILRSLSDRVDEKSVLEIEEILYRIDPLYDKYLSRRKAPTYNFWQTVPPDLPFPNGSTLLSKESYRLPDDYDDTSLVRLAAGRDTIEDKKVRDQMVSYSYRDERGSVEKTLDKYKDHLAYEVFYADKMDQEYDIVVMCNILLFVFDRGYSLNEMDYNTVSLIKQVIQDQDHWNYSEEIAPRYQSTTWILYHLSRLLAIDENGLFDDIKPIVLQDLKKAQNEECTPMEKLLLSSSLLRLGEMPNQQITFADIREDLDDFVFFYAQLSGFSWVPIMKWRSRAFNLTLYYEYKVLSR
ncbi:MAG: hypothetical protein JXR03_18920 [Cyclobacteriaceae bacterium]